jgi:hypothetical protein
MRVGKRLGSSDVEMMSLRRSGLEASEREIAEVGVPWARALVLWKLKGKNNDGSGERRW